MKIIFISGIILSMNLKMLCEKGLTRRFLGMTKLPLLPIRKLPEVSSNGQIIVDVLWLLEASGKPFRWFLSSNMFTGMSSMILGEQFAI